MKRVASLYLPEWAVERLRRRDARTAPPPDAATSPQAVPLAPLVESGAAERAVQCDAPRNTGWRPGARWARAQEREQDRVEVERRIAALPAHQRPPMRMMGRSSEAAEMPFKRLPGDDGSKSSGWSPPAADAVQRRDPATALSTWNTMPGVRYPGDGPHPDKPARRGSNDPHSAPPGVAAFFDTGRSTAGTLARVCRDAVEAPVSGQPDASPLILSHKIGSRLLVAAASPAARALGIAVGMAVTQARACVPGLDIRDADPAADRADLERLAVALARRWTPVVAISDHDGLLLDLSGVAHLHGGERRLATRLVRMLARFGVTGRVAVADTAGAAWALARHADPRRNDAVQVVPANAHAGLIAPLPVAALRLDEAPVELLRRLGVDTIGQLAAIPRGPLVRRFGPVAALRLDQAMGSAPEPLDPVDAPEPIVVAQRFAEPIATQEAIEYWLGTLVPRLTEALAQAGLGARALVLVGERVDNAAQLLRIGLARPNRDTGHILRLLVRRIEEIEPGYGIDSLTLHVLRADPLGPEAIGADLSDTLPDLAPLVDTLANRIGPGQLWRSEPVESDVPERSTRSCAALDPPARVQAPLKQDDVRLLDAGLTGGRLNDHPWHPRWPRPVRLLRRPELLDHVVAELPDQPPRRFTWRGRGHRVVRADGPERITGEWWRHAAERDAVRDYFQVEDEEGRRFWLFRRGDGVRAATGDLAWFLHGTFA